MATVIIKARTVKDGLLYLLAERSRSEFGKLLVHIAYLQLVDACGQRADV